MRIRAIGAAGGEVTGSAFLVQTKLIQQRHGLKPSLPKQGDVIEL